MTRGYDNLPTNMQLLLDLQLREGTGTLTHDFAKPHHGPATLTGTVGSPTWAALGNGLPHLSFDPTDAQRIVLLAAASTDLNFTSGAFSGATWIYPDAYGNRYFMMKGGAGTGWSFWVTTVAPYICFTTEQAGPTYQTTTGAPGLALSVWQLIGFSRSGAVGRVYLNGLDATSAPATHVNPASAAAGDFYIGTTVGGGAGWYDGLMWRPRVWNRNVPATEHLAIFEAERGLFGV